MLFSLFMSIQLICITAETYNTSVFDQLVQNNVEHFWHSYIFHTGSGNREELHFSNHGIHSHFKTPRNVFKWKSIQIEEKVAITGVGNNFLLLTFYNKENDTVADVKDLEGSPIDVILFQKWNVQAQQIKSFAAVAIQISEDNYLLKWFEIFNRSLKFLWDWPFYRPITHLDVIKVGHESKLLVISHNDKIWSADIYDFNVNDIVDVWLFEKIILDDVPSSVTAFNINDNVFLSVSFPLLDMIHVFKYSRSICMGKEEKHFVTHQKIYKVELKSVTSFRVGFHWYLAVASKNSSIYQLTENFSFQPLNSISLSSLEYWLAVPFDSYREDVILLAGSESDVSLITWTGEKNFNITGSFIQLACENDTNCLENVSLKHSTAFSFNGNQFLLAPVKNGSSVILKFFARLKPLPDEVAVKLNDIFKVRNLLEADFNNQNSLIEQLRSNKKYFERVQSVGNLETEYQTKNLTEIMSAVYKLKSAMKSLESYIGQFQKDLKSKITNQNKPKSLTVLPRNIPRGITFYGNVLIHDLRLSVLNGHNVDEILKNSYRKNKIEKLHGKKTLKKLTAENVMFEKLGEILACDIIFSDDLCEEQDKNTISGNVIFENNVNVINEVKLTQHAAFYKSIGKKSLLPYNVLNFDDLEVSEETRIQGNINGELFILPVHYVHLDILDIVNQARVEVVNVETDLQVVSVNGKNLSRFLDEIRRQNESIKLSGAFTTSALEVNNFDLNKENEKMVENRSGKQLDSLKKPNLKRIVHVFQNLNVVGTLMSNRINNVSWAVLKNTVRKGERNVTLGSVKKFQKFLKSPKITSKGTVNGRFVENVLTNFSDQVIWFPQVFDSVEFKNLSVGGSWDGIHVDHLNKAFYRFSYNDSFNSNVTFKDDCIINELNVEESVNEFGFENNKKSFREVKSINAATVILHGSLVTNNKINLMNLTNFDILRVTLKSPQTVGRDLSHYNITVAGDLNLKTLNFNDINDVIISGGDTSLIEKFLAGDIHRIKRLLVKGLVETSHGINGFNLSNVFENGVCIATPNALKGNVTFENIVNFNDINVTDSIDGFSLKKLEKDIVLKHGQVFLNAGKNYSTLKVINNMKTRSLNGHLVQDIVTLKGDHNMKGLVRINGDIVVKGDVTTYSAINNITVTDLLRTFSTKFNSYIYSGDLSMESERVSVKNLLLGGCVQDVSLGAIISDSVKKEKNFILSGKKSFSGKVAFQKNILVENLLHGLNFSNFYSDVVLINEPSKLEGSLKVQEAVLKTLEVKNRFNSKLINKVDSNDWFEESIPLDKYVVVSGKKIFESATVSRDVSVDFINNHLPSAMIFLKEKQHIPVSVLFPKITTAADIAVSGFVNGKNLAKEFQDSILSYGMQKINDKILIKNEFVINGNLLVNSIKGRKVNDLITLDTDQKIRTRLEFKGSVTAKHNVENLKTINGIDIDKWNQNSVALNRDQVVGGFWRVKGVVKTKNINGNGLLYQSSLGNISKDVHDGKLMALEMKNATETDFNAQCRKVEKLSKEFSQLPYLFDQFEITQEIETSAVIDSVISLKIGEAEHLIISFINNCHSSLYEWDNEGAFFKFVRQLSVGPISKWIVAYVNGMTYVVTASLKSSITCEGNVRQSNVWIFKDDRNTFEHLPFENRFADIVQENNTSSEFFSLEENGDLYRWHLDERMNVTSRFLLNVGQNNYKFIDFRITNGLAVSNNREIRQFKFSGNEITDTSLLFFNSQMVALPVDGKILIAVMLKDKVVVYENLLEDKVFSVIHIYKAGSAAWFDYGPDRQAFLVIASHRKLIEVFEYKGVSGFVKIMSFSMLSSKIQSLILSSKNGYQVDRFLGVVQKKKLILLRADMVGDYWHMEDSLC